MQFCLRGTARTMAEIKSVQKSHLFCVVIILINIFHTVQGTDNEDLGRSLQGPVASLDVVFLLERSSKNVMALAPNILQIMDNINQDHPGSKFGVSFFADFSCSDWHNEATCQEMGNNGEAQTDPEGCYTHGQGLTPNKGLIFDAVKSVQPLVGTGDKSAIAALMMTATDVKTGWSSVKERRKRFIFLVTDSATSCCEKTLGVKTPPKGDGTDTCKTMQNPTPELMSDKLLDKDIGVYLLVPKGGPDPDAFSSWKNMFSRFNVAMGLSNLVVKSKDVVYEKFKTFLKKIEQGESYEKRKE